LAKTVFGNSNPFNGDINTSGEVHTTAKGSANMVLIAYGVISREGLITSRSGNFSVNKLGTGVYDLTISGENYVPTTFISMLSRTSDSAGSISAATFTGEFSYDYTAHAVDISFFFVIYKP